MPNAKNFYETPKAISEYLLFHYGKDEDILPSEGGPRDALGFPKRCGELALRHPVAKGRALDLGCAVGRSAFELSAHFEQTIGIDFSGGLIEAARALLAGQSLDAEVIEEGELTRTITLSIPPGARPNQLTFQQGDAMNLPYSLGSFDFVLMANLIDRLPDPKACLESTASFVNSEGLLAITSPYTWLEEHTPKDKWLGGFLRDGEPVRSYDNLKRILAPHFQEVEALDLPFLIREHARKNQYSIAHATLWRRR